MVVDEGHDLHTAVQRAAAQLGIRPQHLDVDIAALRRAVRDYRELFRPQQAETLRDLRRLALQAMQSLAEFQPRLAGTLVHGDGPLDQARLILIADTAEQVVFKLQDLHIPWRDGEVTLQYTRDRRKPHPAFRFMAGDTNIELVVLAPSSRNDPPRDPLGKGPLEMLDVDRLKALIDAAQP